MTTTSVNPGTDFAAIAATLSTRTVEDPDGIATPEFIQQELGKRLVLLRDPAHPLIDSRIIGEGRNQAIWASEIVAKYVEAAIEANMNGYASRPMMRKAVVSLCNPQPPADAQGWFARPKQAAHRLDLLVPGWVSFLKNDEALNIYQGQDAEGLYYNSHFGV